MPELPEVESFRTKVHAGLKGETITDVRASSDPIVFAKKSAAFVKKTLNGAKVKGSGRKGKYFWLELDRKPWPLFHLGMTGSVHLTDKISATMGKAVKLVLTLSDGTFLVFKDPRRFGRIIFINDPEKDEPLAHLGGDVLNDLPSTKALVELLATRKAPIKALLLDQSLFAGVGNWMADEILFQAGISPQRKGSDLSKGEVTTLRAKILSITKAAVKLAVKDRDYPDAWLFQHRWSRKPELPSGEKLKVATVGGRTTVWSPKKQK